MTSTAEFLWPKWSVEGEPFDEIHDIREKHAQAEADMRDAMSFIRQACLEAELIHECDKVYLQADQTRSEHKIYLTAVCANPDHAKHLEVPEELLLRCIWCGMAGPHDTDTCPERKW